MPAPGDSGAPHFVGSRLAVDKAEIGNLQNPAASNIVVTDADQLITGVKGGSFRDWSGAVYNISSSANPSGAADPTGVAAATASIAAAVAALETTNSTVAGGMIVAPQGTFKVDQKRPIWRKCRERTATRSCGWARRRQRRRATSSLCKLCRSS